jgi:predicted  nucleic acid-binding Zn-ribbon protein
MKWTVEATWFRLEVVLGCPDIGLRKFPVLPREINSHVQDALLRAIELKIRKKAAPSK